MRACQLVAVLLVVCLSGAAALRCNRCVPSSGGSCTNTVETCRRTEDVCAFVVVTSPRYFYFKRCMKLTDANILKANQLVQVSTCSTDLCI